MRDPCPSVPSRSPEADAREVEALLRRWYDASEKHDSAAYAALMLPEFFIFEDRTLYDKPTLTRLVAARRSRLAGTWSQRCSVA
jgi:hypothetical protein